MTAFALYGTSNVAEPGGKRSYNLVNLEWVQLSRLFRSDVVTRSYCIQVNGSRREAPPIVASVGSPIDVLTVKQMVETIQSVFALTAAQTAQCVGVSRAALYKHLNNEAVRDMEAYSRVYRIAERVRSEVGILDKRYMSVLVDGKTLIRHLSDKRQDTEAIVGIVIQIRDKLSTRKNAGITPHKPSVSEQRLAARSVSRAG